MIIQGTNQPIMLVFDEDVNAETFSDMEVSLCVLQDATLLARPEIKELKHWDKTDLTINGNVVLAPLTQEETLAFPQGGCTIEAKWVMDNVIYHSQRACDHIAYRYDKTILSGVN